MKRLKMGKVKTCEWRVLFLLLPVLGKSHCPMPAVFFIIVFMYMKMLQFRIFQKIVRLEISVSQFHFSILVVFPSQSSLCLVYILSTFFFVCDDYVKRDQ